MSMTRLLLSAALISSVAPDAVAEPVRCDLSQTRETPWTKNDRYLGVAPVRRVGLGRQRRVPAAGLGRVGRRS
jgi:hypothetical protein